jgi:hypothetical protein
MEVLPVETVDTDGLLAVSFTKQSVAQTTQCLTSGKFMNWKGSGRKWPRYNRDTIHLH